jgi:hypothetical protein
LSPARRDAGTRLAILVWFKICNEAALFFGLLVNCIARCAASPSLGVPS